MPTKKLTSIEAAKLERRNRSHLSTLKSDVVSLKRAVTGYNGKTGLVGHAEKTDLTLIRLEKGQKIIKELLTGDDTDINDQGGVKGKIRELGTMQKVVKRIMWLGIGSIITGSVAIIFTIIRAFLLNPLP